MGIVTKEEIRKDDAFTKRGINAEKQVDEQATLEIVKKASEGEVTRELIENSETVTINDSNNFQYCEVKRSLKAFIEAYQRYLESKDKLDEKKASLQIHTDWGNVFEGKPTVAMKEAYINETTMEKRIENRELYLDKLYKEELYKLEVKRYEKEE